MLRFSTFLYLTSLFVPHIASAQSIVAASGFYETRQPGGAPAGFGGEIGNGRRWVQANLGARTGVAEEDVRYWAVNAGLTISPLFIHPALSRIAPYNADPYITLGASAFLADDGETWSMDPNTYWGLGVRIPVAGPVSVYGEARNNPGWTGRVGIRLGFLRGSRPTILSTAPKPTRATERTATPDPASRPNSSPARTRPATRPVGRAGDILAEAEKYLGVDYVWGGETPEEGFDCSGLVQYVYAKFGVSLPRVTRDQVHAGKSIELDQDQFKPGDLLFFVSEGERIDHVAIYAGEGFILHAPYAGAVVRYDDLDAPSGRWFRNHLVAVKRVV